MLGLDHPLLSERLEVQDDDLLRIRDRDVGGLLVGADHAFVRLAVPLARHHELLEGLPRDRVDFGDLVVGMADRDDRVFLGGGRKRGQRREERRQ